MSFKLRCMSCNDTILEVFGDVNYDVKVSYCKECYRER